MQCVFWHPYPLFLALNQEETLRKMRILTFMGIAVDQKEISFDQIIQTLKITEEEVENFIIEGKRVCLTVGVGASFC